MRDAGRACDLPFPCVSLRLLHSEPRPCTTQVTPNICLNVLSECWLGAMFRFVERQRSPEVGQLMQPIARVHEVGRFTGVCVRIAEKPAWTQ